MTRGQSVVEFFVVLQAWLLGCAFFLFVATKSLVPYLQQIDLYDLSRAHLYGVGTERCASSSLWPRHLLEVRVTCAEIPSHYVSEAFLVWGGKRIPLSRIEYGLWKELP
jgi:hypothetical protein